MNYIEASQEFIKIVKNYNGTLDYKEDKVRFYSDNIITGYYTNGEIWKQNKVRCEISIQEIDNRILLNGHEDSYEIIGGFATSYSKEELINKLDIFNFSKKNYQYSLFDL